MTWAQLVLGILGLIGFVSLCVTIVPAATRIFVDFWFPHRETVPSAPEPFFHDSWDNCTTYGKRYTRQASGHFVRIREDGVPVYLISDRTGEYPLRTEDALVSATPLGPATPLSALPQTLDSLTPDSFERDDCIWHRVEGFPIRLREDGVVVYLTERGDQVPCRDWGATKRYERWAGPGSVAIFEIGSNEVYWVPGPSVTQTQRSRLEEEAAELATVQINHRDVVDGPCDLTVYDNETSQFAPLVLPGEINSGGVVWNHSDEQRILPDGSINVRLDEIYRTLRDLILIELREPLRADQYLGVYYRRDIHDQLSLREFERLVLELAQAFNLAGKFVPIASGGHGPVLGRGYHSTPTGPLVLTGYRSIPTGGVGFRISPQADGNDVQSPATLRSFEAFQSQILGEAYEPDPPPPPQPRRPLGGRGFDL